MQENPEFMKQWAKAQDYGVKMINDDPEKASESIAVELGVKPADAQKLFEGYEYLPAAQQADDDHLGKKLGEDLLATAKFLFAQGSIDKVAAPTVYANGVDPTPAEEGAK
jgi:taurine transport system substrate-binding protein